VLGVVSSEGDVIPPYFFKNKETVTKEIYENILASGVKPWIETVASGRLYVFQQRCTSSHEPFGPKLTLRQYRYFGPRNSDLLIAQI